jgi:hypothetical protein
VEPKRTCENQYGIFFFLLSGRVVGTGRAKDVGRSEDGPVDEKPAPGDARTRHDPVQILSIVHAPRDHRDEVFGTSHVRGVY